LRALAGGAPGERDTISSRTIGVPSGQWVGSSPRAWAAPISHVRQAVIGSGPSAVCGLESTLRLRIEAHAVADSEHE
jgi:hypothetical protein